MYFTYRSKQNQRNTCVRILSATFICLVPLSGFAQETPPNTPASIPLIEPSKVCGPRSPGRCAVGLAKDQAGILTSPFRIRKKDLVWLVPFAAATTTAFAFDRKTLNLISTNPSRVDAYRTLSNVTGIYAPLAAIGATWLVGAFKHDDHLRETGILAGEALADTMLVTEMVKYAGFVPKPPVYLPPPASFGRTADISRAWTPSRPRTRPPHSPSRM